MRVLMLGWEFPPFIAGGLGTACYGLTKALDRRGHDITFVLPKAVDRSLASHVRLLSPDVTTPEQLAARISDVRRDATRIVRRERGEPIEIEGVTEYQLDEFEHVTFRSVPATFDSPYSTPEQDLHEIVEHEHGVNVTETTTPGTTKPGAVSEIEHTIPGEDPNSPTPGFLGLTKGPGDDYAGDLIGDTRRYAEMAAALTRGEQYDVIHAHDWMTFPAGLAIARMTGIPLVIHVHSTEFDRSGEHVHQQIYDIERRAMHGAMRVVTVSYWTKNIVTHKYGVDESKIRVVWNGVDQDGSEERLHPPIESNDKIVLFLGRITMQKGPEYFVSAAKRVLEKIDNVKFIVAGSGDMATRMIELAAQMGIGHKVLFTGFLRGGDVGRVFKMADCYVMPSVSEPFGIAPLEAMSHDVPVIISKQSGVSEVLTHALKVDFWDIDEMANKIIAVLRHPPLGQTLRHHGQIELRNLTWDGAAESCESVYEDAASGMNALLGV